MHNIRALLDIKIYNTWFLFFIIQKFGIRLASNFLDILIQKV